MTHIQKTCGGDLKPGLQLSDGCNAWPHLQGATQQIILSQEEREGNAEVHLLGQQKGFSARGKSRGQRTELAFT